MRKILGVAAVAALASGCAATQPNLAPNHRWVSSEVVTEMEYAQDHQRCLTEAGMTESTRQLDPSSGNYAEYTDCMNSQGYELTAFTDNRSRSPSISH